MSVKTVTDVALAFFLTIAFIGLAVRAMDFDMRWLDRPNVEQSR